MSKITHILNNTAYLVTTATNVHGDQVETERESFPCRFREITELNSLNNREDISGYDALLWAEADVALEEGTVLLCEGRYWRVDRLTKARTLGPDVEFLKCLLEKHNEPEVNDA